MHHETLESFDGEQKLVNEIFYDKSSKDKSFPAVLVFPAFEGRSEFALAVAEKFARKGYVAMAVDIYGNAEVAQTLDECFRLISPFLAERALVRKRALLAYNALKKFSGVEIQNISAIGFCFGGMCALEVARSGEDLSSLVSVHGILAKSDLPNLTIKSKILILQGYQDPQIPENALSQFAVEMKNAGSPDWIFTYFGSAKHSFTDQNAGKFDPDREQKMGREYNRQASDRAFRYAFDFFQE